MRGKVAIAGVFDLYHAGHASALKFAKSLGDHLVVLLYDDEYAAWRKGYPPTNPFSFRKSVLESVKYIDQIIVVSYPLPEVLAELRPDVFVKGSASIPDSPDLSVVNGEDVVEHFNGAVITAPVLKLSTGERLSSSYIKTLISAEAGK